jgi:hypothetical protein
MMARGQSHRPSTLIDPSSLNQRPVSQNILAGSETRPNLSWKGSLGGKPLLNFDEDRSPGLQASPNDGRKGTRSVFGVDTLWEREMAKLKKIEAQEAEEQMRQEAAEAAQMEKKSKKKKKGRNKVIPQAAVPVEEPRALAEAPVPPVVQRPIARTAPPPPGDDETESSSGSSDAGVPRPPPPRTSADDWHSGESDKEMDGPVRTTGIGPRYPNRGRGRASAPHPANDDDSEEDMPLAATVSRAVQRATRLGLSVTDASDSDEEKPLSQLLTKSKYLESSQHLGSEVSATPGLADGGNNEEDEEDEDDKPLGLRVSRFMSSQSQFGNVDDVDDDDRPLGLHPEQQRRTQYNMFLQQQQQQQQQQQLLLQAQMQQSMMFSTPSLIGSAFFGPPVIPQMMPLMPQQPPASPPPGTADMTKFGRVDRWRHEIVRGQP